MSEDVKEKIRAIHNHKLIWESDADKYATQTQQLLKQQKPSEVETDDDKAETVLAKKSK